MRVLTCQKLPEEESDFFELMSYFFPKVYDVKYLMKSCKNLKGGLQEVADSLKVCSMGMWVWRHELCSIKMWTKYLWYIYIWECDRCV